MARMLFAAVTRDSSPWLELRPDVVRCVFTLGVDEEQIDLWKKLLDDERVAAYAARAFAKLDPEDAAGRVTDSLVQLWQRRLEESWQVDVIALLWQLLEGADGRHYPLGYRIMGRLQFEPQWQAIESQLRGDPLGEQLFRRYALPDPAAIARLKLVVPDPVNGESPLWTLGLQKTPVPFFFVRTHFNVPELNGWHLAVGGAVKEELSLDLDSLRDLPPRTLRVTLECAGNARSALGKSVLGESVQGVPWGHGAVGTGDFTGVPLREVLNRAGLGDFAREILFEGVDRGRVKAGSEEDAELGGAEDPALESKEIRSYERSLPLEVANDPDVLLAWEMNGRPLTRQHGHPLRLIVPGWYGMAWVKWLHKITALEEEFAGLFQADHYTYSVNGTGEKVTRVTRVKVRSVIAYPEDNQRLYPKGVLIRGSAWSGHGRIKRVRVSTDEGIHWDEADLEEPIHNYDRTLWSLDWRPRQKGTFVLMARAIDEAGNEQPLEGVWNRRGYGNNAVHRVRVTVL